MTDAIDLDAAVDEMHGAVLAALPTDLLDLSDIPMARRRFADVLGAMPAPELPDTLAVSEAFAEGWEGDPNVRLKLYRPEGLPASAPTLYWIHGGGMVLSDADSDDLTCALRARAQNCLVVSVDYRLAPETPAPGPVNDCYAGLRWVAANADQLGIDRDRIMIGGASAGGGLAAWRRAK